jgi:hypothetical protein
MKTGTTFVQRLCYANRPVLARRGVALPGATWGDQVAGSRDLTGRPHTDEPAAAGSWDRLVAATLAVEEPTALISMEFLSLADPTAARRAVASFPDAEVTVLVTARDLVRVLPSMWQERTKTGGALPFEAYLAALAAPGARSLPRTRDLWRSLDVPAMLRTWAAAEPATTVVVTVPPAGADPSTLWQRVAEVLGVEPGGLAPPARTNEGLGRVSAELMRRLQQGNRASGVPIEVREVLKQRLAQQVLAARRDREPPVVLPERFRAWAAQQTARQADELRTLGPVVVGDLEDLVVPERPGPRWWAGRLGAERDSPSTEDLLEAALDGLTGLAEQLTAVEARPRGRARQRDR